MFDIDALQGLARRRGSAPVSLMPILDDISVVSVPLMGDRYFRRGSVPTDITAHQSN